jgi:recombination protein RecR
VSEARAEPIERLVRALRRLPGIGEKTATRLAYHLLSAPETLAAELG